MTHEVIAPRTHWIVEAFTADGKLKWTEEFDNLVTDAGINDLLTQYFKGAGYNAAWYVGLVNTTPTFAVTDTMGAHAGWTENSNYTAATRPLLSLGPVGNKTASNIASKALFTMNGAGGTIAGVFLTTGNAKAGTTGVLYSEAAFASGNKTLVAGEILAVTCTVAGA